MKRTRKTEITIETERVLVIRKAQRTGFAWCAQCAAQVEMVTPAQAAVLARVSARTIYRWVEVERLHFKETRDGWLLVCLNSLLNPTE